MATGKDLSIVLAGAAAKGAFEAGALSVIVERGHRVRKIVAASSGALNGVALAAGIRDGRAPAAVAELEALWRERGGVRDVLHPTLRGLVHMDGLSDAASLGRLLTDNVSPASAIIRHAISLVIVVGRLAGRSDHSLGHPITTFEQAMSFADDDFDSVQSLERVFAAATASATFPALFAPVVLPGLGPCVDGGVVNNTPIHYAVDPANPPDAVLIICALPAIVDPIDDDVGGPRLFTRLVDALINERLYRDLFNARAINDGLAKLAALGLPSDVHDKVLAAIGWKHRHRVEFVSVRPERELRGGPFDAFFDLELRVEYIEAGRKAAARALEQSGLG